jgi:hypothetical protein
LNILIVLIVVIALAARRVRCQKVRMKVQALKYVTVWVEFCGDVEILSVVIRTE